MESHSQINAQTNKASVENSPICSKRSINLIETDRGEELLNKFFTHSLNKNKIKRYYRNTSLGAVFGERFNGTIRSLLEKPIFQSKDGTWIDILPSTTKQ